MRVLVDAVGIGDGGGAHLLEVFLENLGQVRPGWSFCFVVTKKIGNSLSKRKLQSNTNLIVLSNKNWIGRFFWLNRGLLKTIEHQKCDALLSFANVIPIHIHVPTVLFLHQSKVVNNYVPKTCSERLRIFLLRSYLSETVAGADYVVVQTNHMKQSLSHRIPEIMDRIRVISSPVTLPRSSNVERDISFRLCYVSLSRPHKNHLNLIRALRLVANEIPEVSLALTLDRSDDPVLSKEVTKLGLDSHIEWLGFLGQDELSDLYGRVNLSVFPSLEESFGLPLAESVSMGVPVVAADLPYAHEILGSVGKYFDPLSVSSISNVIIEALRFPFDGRELLASAENYRVETVVGKYCDLIEESRRNPR